MDKLSLAYAVEQKLVPDLDPDVLRRKAEAHAERVRLAHRTVFVEDFGWSEQLPEKTGYYYFADSDDDAYVIVELAQEDGKLEVHYAGSDVAFPLEAMDGKWKPVPVPAECLRP